METCILLPRQFSVVMCAPDDPGVGSPFDLGVTLWANEHLLPGLNFDPEDGDATLDRLECFSKLPPKNVRWKYGCVEQLVDVDGRLVRHCNWVRFLRATSQRHCANLEPRKSPEGRSMYTVIRTVKPNQELCCYFPPFHVSDNNVGLCSINRIKNTNIDLESRVFNTEQLRDMTESNKTTVNKEQEIPSDNFQVSIPTNMDSAKTKTDKNLNKKSICDNELHLESSDLTKNVEDKENNVETPKRHRKTRTPKCNSISIYHNTQVKRPLSNVASPEIARDAPDHLSSPICSGVNSRSPTSLTNTSPSSASDITGSDVSPRTLGGGGQGSIAGSKSSPGSEKSSLPSPPAQLHTTESEGEDGAESELELVDSVVTPEERTLSRNIECRESFDDNSLSPQRTPLSLSTKSYTTTEKDVTSQPYIQSPFMDMRNATQYNLLLTPVSKGSKYPSSDMSVSLARLQAEYMRSRIPIRFYPSPDSATTMTEAYRRQEEQENANHSRDSVADDGVRTDLQPATPQNTVVRRREKTWLPCEVCGKKFDRPSLLKRHIRTHTGEKPHACDVCGKAFSTSSSLNTHRRIHSGEKPHQCQTCGKRFTASSNLYYHRMTHKKEKPHKCTLCAKSFPTPGDLRSHMYVHSGSWPYKCTVCNRGFSKQTNLKNHTLLHSGDKLHCCSICDKKFALQCNLKTHIKTHEEDGESCCCRCGQGFVGEGDFCSSCTSLIDANGRPSNCLSPRQTTAPNAHVNPAYNNTHFTAHKEHTDVMPLYRTPIQQDQNTGARYGQSRTVPPSLPMHLHSMMAGYFRAGNWSLKQ